jgi:hypothetical protein
MYSCSSQIWVEDLDSTGQRRSRSPARAAVAATGRRSPSVVRERLIGLGHAVRVLALADRRAPILCRVQQLVRQAIGHRLLAAVAGRLDDPAHRQRLPAARAHLHRYLIGGPTDAPGFDLDDRLDVVERLREQLDRFRTLAAGFLADAFNCTVEDLLSGGLLAAFLPRLAPYLDRPCLRLPTPAQSSVPRTVW